MRASRCAGASTSAASRPGAGNPPPTASPSAPGRAAVRVATSDDGARVKRSRVRPALPAGVAPASATDPSARGKSAPPRPRRDGRAPAAITCRTRVRGPRSPNPQPGAQEAGEAAVRVATSDDGARAKRSRVRPALPAGVAPASATDPSARGKSAPPRPRRDGRAPAAITCRTRGPVSSVARPATGRAGSG